MSFDINSAEDLELFLIEANRVYRTGDQPDIESDDYIYFISDAEYDILVEKLRVLNPESALLNSVEEEIIGGAKYKHSKPMLSTQKFYEQSEVENWLGKLKLVADDLGVELMLKITPKLDGFAGSYENDILATRGNGIVGNNITHILDKGVLNVSSGSPYGRGEIVVNKKYFDEYLSDDFSHPRNFINSVLATETSNPLTTEALKSGAVSFYQYCAFENAIFCTPSELLVNIDKYKETIKESTPFLIDGYVVEAVNEEVKQELGHNNSFHLWQAAIKEIGEAVDVEVTEIVYQVGRTGILTPVVNFKPTYISGAMVQRATGSSMRLMFERNIGVNSIISVVRSGEVIPTILGVARSSPKSASFQEPECCPSCGQAVAKVKTEFYCENAHCSGKTVQKILHTIRTLSICDGFGDKTVERIAEYWFNEKGTPIKFSDLFSFNYETFKKIGFGDGESLVLVRAINDIETKKVDDNLILASIGISGIGVRDSAKVLDSFPIDKIEDIVVFIDGEYTLVKEFDLAGFGDVKKKLLAYGIFNNIDEIKKMLANMNVNKRVVIDRNSIEENHYKDKNVVITGSFVHNETKINRDKMTALVVGLGGIVKDSVNSKTDILIAGDKAGSKLSKAAALGSVEILSQSHPLVINLMSQSL